jgi:hypothetical protein
MTQVRLHGVASEWRIQSLLLGWYYLSAPVYIYRLYVVRNMTKTGFKPYISSPL